MICSKCGTELPAKGSACPTCKDVTLVPEPARLTITGYPVGIIIEGPPDYPTGRSVDYRPPSGGRSRSEIDAVGAYRVELSGSVECGRPGEPRVLKTLAKKIRDAGRTLQVLSGANDARGEDGLFLIAGVRLQVQIVSLPATADVWRELEKNTTVLRVGDRSSAIAIVRRAIEAKRFKAQGTLLALDAANFGAVISTKLVEAYLATHGDPSGRVRFCRCVDRWADGTVDLSVGVSDVLSNGSGAADKRLTFVSLWKVTR